MRTIVCLFIVLSALGLSMATDTIDSSIVISNCRRNVDATTSLAKFSNSITFENTGSASVSSVHFAVSDDSHPSLSSLTAKETSSKKALKVIPVEVSHPQSATAKYYKIRLHSQLAAGDKVTVVVRETYFEIFRPFPAKIKQKESQKFMFEFNSVLLSPYKVVTQNTVITVPNTRIDSHSGEGASLVGKKLSVGSKTEKPPMSVSPGHIHFESVAPFLTVDSLDRYVEVSHWGKINVYDTVWLRHSGAELTGEFSRLDYMQSGNDANGPSVISFTTLIPKSADHIFYRDEIGNVSTSTVRPTMKNLAIDVKLRFPLFGGWKTNFVLSYQLPTHEFITVNGGEYTLKLPFLLHLTDNVPYKSVKWHIVLPETSSDIQLDIPFEVENRHDTLTVTYLDTAGRPTINFEKSSISEEYEVNFNVKYNFNKLMMLREPIMIISAFLVLFISVIVYVRLDFSLEKDARRASFGIADSKIGNLCEKVVQLQNKRIPLYENFDKSCSKLINTLNSSKFSSEKSEFDAVMDQLNEKTKALVEEIKEAGSPASKEIKEILHLERSKQQLYEQLYTVHRRFVGKEIKADPFNESCKSLNGQADKIDSEIDARLSYLGF